MNDASISPLEQAQQLLSDIRQNANGELSAQLGELSQLLDAAQMRGDGQDAEALRQQIESLIETNAQFASVMVHEIRIPMTSIKGYSDMLAKNIVGELNEMQTQFVETIRSNVIRMEHLVTDISDISKIAAGRLRLEAKMDMYKNIAMRVEKDTADLVAEHNHTLVFDTPDGLPLLNLDGVRLAQAITKLVANALQYTPESSEIVVRASEENGKVRVAVIDQGVGMTEEEQSHIGELFWRADNELVRSFKGHGLGLPIAIGLVKQMGGEFFVETEAGKGSTFGFVVPGMS